MTQRLLNGAPAPFEGETIQVGALDSYEARAAPASSPVRWPPKPPRRSPRSTIRLVATTADSALTLPFDWYSSDEVLRRERNLIFARSWQYGGRAEQVAAPGAFLATDAGGIPILVVRDAEGACARFLNVCRHRAPFWPSGGGTRETTSAPTTRGRTTSMGRCAPPRARPRAGLRQGRLGRCCRPARYLGAVPLRQRRPRRRAARRPARRVARAGRGAARRRRDAVPPARSRASRRTGRSCVENFLECYHCAVAHPASRRRRRRTPTRTGSRRARVLVPVLGPARARGEAQPVPFLLAEHRAQRLPRSAEPLDRADSPAGAVAPTAILDYFFAPDADPAWIEEFFALRRPGRPRGHGARRVGAPRHGVRRARAGAAAAERRAAAVSLPGLAR